MSDFFEFLFLTEARGGSSAQHLSGERRPSGRRNTRLITALAGTPPRMQLTNVRRIYLLVPASWCQPHVPAASRPGSKRASEDSLATHLDHRADVAWACATSQRHSSS